MKLFLKNFLKRNLYLIIAATLLLVAGYLTRFILKSNFSDNYWKNSVQSFLQKREKDFINATTNQQLINSLANEDYSADQLSHEINKDYSFLLYQTENNTATLKFWNSQELLLPDSLLKKKDGNYFYVFPNGQYEFMKRSLSYENNHLIAVALIPIRKQYYITISGLKPEFENFPLIESRFRITQHTTEFPVNNSFGETLFYLEKKEPANLYVGNWISGVFILTCLLLFLIVLHNLAHSISEKYGSVKGIVFLIVSVLLLRSVVYFFPSFFNLRQFELFDPTIYSSSFVLNSLGDLSYQCFVNVLGNIIYKTGIERLYIPVNKICYKKMVYHRNSSFHHIAGHLCLFKHSAKPC